MRYRNISYNTLSAIAARMWECKEFFVVGPTPNAEEATQVGTNYEDNIIECDVYADQIQREFGKAPSGCQFVIISNSHEFGTYHEVGILFDTDDEAAESFAYQVENGCENWDETSLLQLRERGHHLHTAKVLAIRRA